MFPPPPPHTQDLLSRLDAWNVSYAEIRFGPVLHTLQGLTSEQAVQAAIRGGWVGERAGETDHGYATPPIACRVNHG